jgi:AcrR family transcriptional regulator
MSIISTSSARHKGRGGGPAGRGVDVSGPVRTDRRVVRTRRKVLDAVRTVLAEEGAAAVTHQRIAAAAGVARATMYLHWPDPTHLLLDAVAEMPLPEVVPSTGDLRGDLLAALGVMRDLLARPPLVAVFAELLARAEEDPRWAQARRALYARADRPLQQLLTRARDEGLLALGDVDPAVAQLLGPLVFRRLVQGGSIPDEFVAEVVDLFLAGAARPS